VKRKILLPDKIAGPVKKRVFYGWFSLAGVMIVMFLVGGCFVYAFGVLLPVITLEFGWSRAEVAGALSIGIICFGLPSPLWGILTARLGPRFTLIVGNLIAGLGIAGIFFIQEIWHIYVLYALIGMGAGLGGYIPGTTIINNWFIKKRSLALGIFMACAGLGGLVLPPLTTALISAIDWRFSWLVLSGLILVIVVLLGCVILVRNKPEDMGQRPDGMPAESHDDLLAEETSSVVNKAPDTWRIRDVFKGPTVWLIGGFAAANTITMGMLVTHLIAYLQDIGFNPMSAATTMSFMAIFGIIGPVLFGSLALKINAKKLAIAAFIVQFVGLVTLIMTRELGFIYVFTALHGISNGSLITAMPTIVGTYYPREHYSRVLGVVFPFQICANAFGPVLAGLIYDASGSYTPAFFVAAASCLTGLFLVSMSRKPRLT
jgi:MFS family permease